MAKRSIVRIISFLSVGILIFGGFSLKFYRQKEYLAVQTENRYKNSLCQFAEMISQIDTDLKKQQYAVGEYMKSTLSGDIIKSCATAKICLAELPVNQENTEGIYKYLATVGDFSRVISLTNDDNEKNLLSLIEFSENLNTDIDILINSLDNKDFFGENIDSLFNSLNFDTDFSSEFENVSQISKTFPTLIYDGPFSDHINRLSPKHLENKGSITETQGKKIANSISKNSELLFTGEENSQISSYIYEGENATCAITKKGGVPLYYYDYSIVTKKNISNKKAITQAKSFLKRVFKKDFKQSYYEITDNIITINFAVKESGIIYYSDLIKVGISLENGNIKSLETRGFIMNNHERALPKFLGNKNKIKSKISKKLKITAISKALILDSALKEKYCFEVKCKTQDKSDIIIYLNKDTLEEENILFLIHSDNGTLTK